MLWDRSYDEIDLGIPSKPALVVSEIGLHVLYLSDGRVHHLLVDRDGEILKLPAQLPGPESAVDYSVAGGPEGQISIWSTGDEDSPGLFAAELDAERPVVIDPADARVSIAYDAQGNLHATWIEMRPGSGPQPILYAVYANGRLNSGSVTEIAAPRLSGAAHLTGPVLGISRSRAYIAWTVAYFSGEQAGTSQGYYVHFPLGDPEAASLPTVAFAPESYDLEYDTMPDQNLLTGPRVLLDPDRQPGTGYLARILSPVSAGEEVVFPIESVLDYLLRKSEAQVSALYMRQGRVHSYQLLSFTSASSSNPYLSGDHDGYLYLTWLEKGAAPGWAVYFASTAPKYVEELAPLTLDDAARLGAETVFGLLSGALLFPFAFIWIMPAFVVLLIGTRMLPRGDDFPTLGSLTALILTISTLWLIKIAFLPDMLEYAPFSAWLPFISEEQATLIRGMGPWGILAVGLGGAALWSRRGSSPTTLAFGIVYLLIDGVLTMALYAVAIYAGY